MDRWVSSSLVLLLGCGPTVSGPQEGSSGANGSSETSADDESTGQPASPCMPAADADAGIIRTVDGGYRIEFGRYDFGDETFGCDAEPPCVGPDGRHTQLVIQGPGVTPIGEYSGEAGTVTGTERWCGCCNGEGGEIDPTWDYTDPIDNARVTIDGTDASCVSGSWSATPTATTVTDFVLTWCP